MIKIKSRILLVSIGMIQCFSSFGQDQKIPESFMRSNGKIYVVMAICLTILAGLIVYLISIDRKIKKIEEEK